MDRRIRKTRAAIFAAFVELLTEKKYEQITVENIINRANIGRSTFYAHFETKDMLLKTICQDLFRHIFEDHPSAEKSHDFSSGNLTQENRLTHILYHLRDGEERFSLIFSCESADLFWAYFREEFSRMMDHSSDAVEINGQKIPTELYMNCCCSTFIEAVKWWFSSGFPCSPEELSSYFESFIAK